jgi:hypothetical protein
VEEVVKNGEGSEVLPCLQANRLVWHSFMDADGRQESPVSEGKASLLLTAMAVTSVCTWSCFPEPGFSKSDPKKVKTPALQERNSELWVAKSFRKSSRYALL